VLPVQPHHLRVAVVHVEDEGCVAGSVCLGHQATVPPVVLETNTDMVKKNVIKIKASNLTQYAAQTF
jgi:hypothetical protein